MVKIYKFDYGMGEASATFEVDTDIFTPEMANDTLTFFCWNYDKDGDPIDEVMKKYAMQAIRLATEDSMCCEESIISDFERLEGFGHIDGSIGITLTEIYGYELCESRLSVEIEENDQD
ncbi:MAG: DUF2528 family protein [Dysgonomonas sp.]|nr:DUF2528 family protein [Dysgonomonas sp.]